MRILIIAATLTVIAIGLAASSRARDCQTNCWNNGSGQSTCNTHCW